MPTPDLSPLLAPGSLGALKLKNRVVYPAMTRARSAGRVVNSEVVKYYCQRSSAGLIITEPSAVCEQAVGFLDTPDMYTSEHAQAWSAVTKALHGEESCRVVAQLWHTGRMSHSSFLKGEQIFSASALRIEDTAGVPACGVQGADGKWYEHERPCAMTTSEVEAVVKAFGKSAALAKAAGFDGIEIHAASGYLIDTFLQQCSNTRNDKYGGDAAGRFTFLAEVLAAVSASFPLDSVGVKLSPNNGFNGMGSKDAHESFMLFAALLSKMGVGYLHVVDGVGPTSEETWYGRVNSGGFHGLSAPITLAELKSAFPGALIGNGGYTAESAAARIASGAADAISFGRVYMTNPDLVERFRTGRALAALPPKTEWFEPSDSTRANVSTGYTEYGEVTKRATLLHLLGSPTSTYYEELSLMYARGCVSANDDGEYRFVYAVVHPGALMSFPMDLSPETLERTPKVPAGAGVGRLAALGADVCQSHMFCQIGVSTYRALLDLLSVPFIGGSVDAMTLTTHKARTRAVVAEAGVPVAAGEVLRKGMRPTLAMPYILKPCSEDNSMGIGVVHEASELEEKLAEAFEFDDEVLCEQFIPPGRELRFGVLEDESGAPTITLPAVEYFLSAAKPVRTSSDKTNVDENGKPVQFAKPARACPAEINEPLRLKLVDAVTRAHAALGCRDYSLYDFRVDPHGEIYFLEATLFCCFAPNSVICLMADASGRTELKPTALFKTMVRRALARKITPTSTSTQTLGSKPKAAKPPVAAPPPAPLVALS